MSKKKDDIAAVTPPPKEKNLAKHEKIIKLSVNQENSSQQAYLIYDPVASLTLGGVDLAIVLIPYPVCSIAEVKTVTGSKSQLHWATITILSARYAHPVRVYR